MNRYRKKPVEIEAVQIPAEGDSFTDAECEWLLLSDRDIESNPDGSLSIHTLEGVMEGRPGDWIIKGVAGEYYPCKPDIFAATYDPVTPKG
ncbi:MAG: hypothetical protein AAGI03_16995 [Pseudomonadota bacterium]